MKKWAAGIAERTSLIYWIFGVLWIFISDHLASIYVGSVLQLKQFEIFKGLIFVTLTAILIYFLLQNQLSQLKQSGRALKKSENRLRTVIRSLPDLVWLKDFEGRYLACNSRFERFFGDKENHIVGKTDYDFVDRNLADFFVRQDRIAFEKGRPNINEEAVTFADDGHQEILETIKTPIFSDSGQFIGVLGIGRDITERKKSEEALRESENRYRSVVDTVSEGIILQAASGEILTWNKGAEKIFGIPAETIVGKNSEEQDWPTVHEDGSKYEGCEHPSLRTLTTGEPCANEIMGVYQPSGALRWISINTNPLFKENDDKPYAVAISFSDITELEEHRRELKESQAILQAAMDCSQAGIAIAEAPDGQLRYVNESALQIRGKTEREIVEGVGIDKYVAAWQILHLDGTPYEDDEVPLARAILYGETCTKEFIVRRSNQEDRIVWANAAPIKNERGETTFGIVVFLDITEQKEAQEALLKSEERMKLALDSVSDAVWVWRVDTGEVYFSSRWYTMLGYEPYEMPQEFETWRNLLHPDDLQRSEKIVFSHLENAESFEIEFRMRTKNDQWRWILARGRTVEQNDQGKGIRMLGTHMDITERKIMAERIQQSQKMESIGSLAGGIAHDFNNLLFPIIGLAEMLLEDLPTGSPEHENAGQILQAGLRGGELVKQILTFSRQSDQKMIPTRAQTVIREVIKLSRKAIPSNIIIHEDIQPDCGFIMANPTQIHQVAMNLVTNAYHAVEDEGGTIFISLKETILKPNDLPGSDIETNQPILLLRISDTGQGIREDHVNKIFEPYFTTKDKGKGTGLGLAVVHGIVKDQGGAIKVTSEIGKGTIFDIYLPLMDQAIPSQRAGETGEPAAGSERILLVDDEEGIARIEKEMLERMGYTITVRNSSTDALQAFKANPDAFDLVITDMTMPNMTGDTLAKELKSVRPDIPVIICTGFSERMNQEKAKKTGINGFLMKPIVRSEMGQLVREVLDTSQAAAVK